MTGGLDNKQYTWLGDKTVAVEVLAKGLAWVQLVIGDADLAHLTASQKNTMTLKLRSSFGWLLLVALGMTTLKAQDSLLPVSRTAGALTISLPKNKPTLVALPLADIVATGTVVSVDGAGLYTLTGTLPDVTTTAHALKITSRVDQRGAGASAPAGTSTNAYGLSAKITAATGQQVTAALATAPNVGDEFVIYKLRTLGQLFTGAALNTNASEASADVVYLSNGGVFTPYFNTGSAWVTVANPSGADQSGVVLEAGSAALIVRKNLGADTSVRVTGVTLPGRESGAVTAGFKLVNNPFSISTTLEASGLQQHITGGAGPGSADTVYLENNGVITGYYYKNGGLGGSGWRALGDNVSNQGAALVRPGKSILFKEQAGLAGVALPEPFAE